MQANQIAGVLIPSRVFDQQHPGHMAVKFLAPDGEPAVRGFRFTPDELPEEYQPAEKWREFFKREDGRVPGYIMDEFAFEQRCTHYSGQVITRSWPIRVESVVEDLYPSERRRLGWYSFDPDRFLDCNNCVTWAARTINQAAGEDVLQFPENGRVRKMVHLLESIPE